MRLCFLYHPVSEYRRPVEDYTKEFVRRHGQAPELISVDTKVGADMAKLYDVVQYPALLVIDDKGALVKYWQGVMLPLMDEVAGYLRA